MNVFKSVAIVVMVVDLCVRHGGQVFAEDLQKRAQDVQGPSREAPVVAQFQVRPNESKSRTDVAKSPIAMSKKPNEAAKPSADSTKKPVGAKETLFNELKKRANDWLASFILKNKNAIADLADDQKMLVAAHLILNIKKIDVRNAIQEARAKNAGTGVLEKASAATSSAEVAISGLEAKMSSTAESAAKAAATAARGERAVLEAFYSVLWDKDDFGEKKLKNNVINGVKVVGLTALEVEKNKFPAPEAGKIKPLYS